MKRIIITAICMLAMIIGMSASVGFADSEADNTDVKSDQQAEVDMQRYGPGCVVGEFRYDPEYAKLIAEKERLAEEYVKAKESGDIGGSK